MDRVYHPSQRPFRQVRSAGIAIREVDTDQRHIGLLHAETATGIHFLHLAWHKDLRQEAPRDNYHWVDPVFPESRLRQVAAVCRLVWRANGRNSIPYGFSPPSDCFDANNGQYLFGPTQYGLTCATFILAVFHRAGLPLVRYETWPTGRPGDPKWQEAVVRGLLDTPSATPEHIRAVQNDVGTVRYRPEEVAASATIRPSPADFNLAETRGEELLRVLRSPPQRGGISGILRAIGKWIHRCWTSIARRVSGS
jgi:hypothetical protein